MTTTTPVVTTVEPVTTVKERMVPVLRSPAPQESMALVDMKNQLELHRVEILELRALFEEAMRNQNSEALWKQEIAALKMWTKDELQRMSSALEARLNMEISGLRSTVSDLSRKVPDPRLEQLMSTLRAEQENNKRRELAIYSQINSLQERINSLETKSFEKPVVSREMPSFTSFMDTTTVARLPYKLQSIQSRGNILVDGSRIEVLKQIPFAPRRLKDAPTAELSDPGAAKPIFDDIAAACQHLGEKVIVEGHTKGGTTKFWQELADNRARLVGQALIDRGVDPTHLTTRGLPGTRGLNKVTCVVHVMPAEDPNLVVDTMGEPQLRGAKAAMYLDSLTAIQAAQEALQWLDKEMVEELKSMRDPVQEVMDVCAACAFLLYNYREKPEWHACQKMMKFPGQFLEKCARFDIDGIPELTITNVSKLVSVPWFNYDGMKIHSVAAAHLATWVVHILRHHNIDVQKAQQGR